MKNRYLVVDVDPVSNIARLKECEGDPALAGFPIYPEGEGVTVVRAAIPGAHTVVQPATGDAIEGAVNRVGDECVFVSADSSNALSEPSRALQNAPLARSMLADVHASLDGPTVVVALDLNESLTDLTLAQLLERARHQYLAAEMEGQSEEVERGDLEDFPCEVSVDIYRYANLIVLRRA